MNKVFPISTPALLGREKELLAECVESTFVSTMGSFLQRFEKMLSERHNGAECALVNSGTSALHLGLIELGVSDGEIVIIPDFTFIATFNASQYVRATPFLIDCEEDYLGIDPKKLSRFLEEDCEKKEDGLFHRDSGKRIACILPVCVFGSPLLLEDIKSIAQSYDVPVLLDAAGALGASYKGKPLTEFSDIVAYSFNGNKIITSGGGGALMSKNKKFIEHARFLCSTARKGNAYVHQEVAYNYRMTNIEAALGVAQLEQLDSFIKRKKEIFECYSLLAKQFPCVEGFPAGVEEGGNYWLSGLYFKESSREEVKEIVSLLNDKGIMAREFWVPLHSQPCASNYLGNDFQNSSDIWYRYIPLPCSSHLTETDLHEIVDRVKEVLKVIFK